MPPAQAPSVLILGAGEFGSAAAVSLLQAGYSVQLLDKASVLPAEDAATTDINKIIRSDYGDPFYHDLAKHAIKQWRSPKWKDCYHECGVMVLGMETQTSDGSYARQVFDTVKANGEPVQYLDNPAKIHAALKTPRTAFNSKRPRQNAKAFLNPNGGWAHTKLALQKLHDTIRNLGGLIYTGQGVESLLYDGDKVVGVKSTSGKTYNADLVIIATGAWTSSIPAFKGLFPEGLLTPTGQVVATIKLPPDMARKYSQTPVTLAFDGTGFYTFPPNSDGILKFAIHGGGYLTPDNIPRTTLTETAISHKSLHPETEWIPKRGVQDLRTHLSALYPELASLDFSSTRLCWYSDTSDSNFLIDYHPRFRNLLVATGGSGHAAKFLPILGALVVKRIEGRLEPEAARRWGFESVRSAYDPGRLGMERRVLKVEELAQLTDLKAKVRSKL